MDSYTQVFNDLVRTMSETRKIVWKNFSLITSITITTVSIYSLILLINFFSVKSVIEDLLVKQGLLLITSPNTADFANVVFSAGIDFGIFSQVQSIFALVFSIATLFISTITILATAVTYSWRINNPNSHDDSLSLKDLVLSITARKWRNVVVTLFYVTLLGLGYIFISIAFMFPVLLLNRHPVLSVFLSIFGSVFYSHLGVVWTLASITCVVESEQDAYGLEAIGKAAKIVKGMELHGFLLNLSFAAFSFLVFLLPTFIYRFSNAQYSTLILIVVAFLVLNGVCLVRMLWLIAFTVFYFECKDFHGEEDVSFQLKGSSTMASSHNSQLSTSSSTMPLISSAFAEHTNTKISIDVL